MISQKIKFPLPPREGIKGRGINNLAKILDSSPSPQPSPVKGGGVFLTLYDYIKFQSSNFKIVRKESYFVSFYI
jgi:hypothetical protein